MKRAYLAITAGVVLPGTITVGMYAIPMESARQAAPAQAKNIATLTPEAEKEEPQQFVLQPFYVPGGAFLFHVVVKGKTGLSALCSNLPIVHDAIITQLDEDSRLFAKPSNTEYEPDGNDFRRMINASFSRPYVLRVDVAYHANTEVSLAGRRKVGAATRCSTVRNALNTESDR